jgi:hypothetical protein
MVAIRPTKPGSANPRIFLIPIKLPITLPYTNRLFLAGIKFIVTISYLAILRSLTLPQSLYPPLSSNNNDKGKNKYKENKENKQITVQRIF